MSKNRKITYTGFGLILLGLIVGIVGFALLGFNPKKLGNVKVTNKEFTSSESFDSISIKSEVSDVKIKRSEDNTFKVEYDEVSRMKTTVAIEDGVLKITEKDTRRWYDYIIRFNIGFFNAQSKIVVYLPDEQYKKITVSADTASVKLYSVPVDGDIVLKTDTGSIDVFNLSCDNLSASTDTGSVELETIRCNGNVKLGTDTGSIKIKDTIAVGDLKATTDTGSVTLKDMDAANITVKTDTGSIKGTILTEKIIFAKADTGSVKVPESVTGGKCNLTTDTGSIKISYSK